jgi:O-methyltransferase involved in polyketide biosynthesis
MIEIDFYEVVSKKLQVISSKENLISLIRSHADGDIPIIHDKHINSHQYKLFAQDIRETEVLGSNLTNLGVDFTAPTLVLTECLLVYLKKEDSDRILSSISNFFSGDLLFLNYEMIHPGDAFGRVMIENLEVGIIK